MFIHIGNNEVIKGESIIAIVNYQLVKETEQLHTISKNKEIIKLIENEESIKSIIITNDFLFYSPLSSATLKKRENLFVTISKLDTLDYVNNVNEGE